MSRHTEGPWSVGPESGGFSHIVTGYSVLGPQGKRIAAVDLDGDDPVGYANARLIAAAPALFYACREALDEFLPWNLRRDALAYALSLANGRELQGGG